MEMLFQYWSLNSGDEDDTEDDFGDGGLGCWHSVLRPPVVSCLPATVTWQRFQWS